MSRCSYSALYVLFEGNPSAKLRERVIVSPLFLYFLFFFIFIYFWSLLKCAGKVLLKHVLFVKKQEAFTKVFHVILARFGSVYIGYNTSCRAIKSFMKRVPKSIILKAFDV